MIKKKPAPQNKLINSFNHYAGQNSSTSFPIVNHDAAAASYVATSNAYRRLAANY